MNLLRTSCLVTLSCLALRLAAADPVAATVLLCGPPDQIDEFKRVYDHCGVKVHSLNDPLRLAELPLEQFNAVTVCFDNLAQLTALPATAGEALKTYLAGGGTVYLESCGNFQLPGWEFGSESLLMKDERLLVTTDEWSRNGLPPDTLLEEQNSYRQPVACPGGDRLLTYGLWLGTGKLYPIEIKDYYEIKLTLPEPAAIKTITQYYGGLQPNYTPDKVELFLGNRSEAQRSIGVVDNADFVDNQLVFTLPEPVEAQVVTFRITKHRKSAATDFLVLNSLQILDADGNNLSEGLPYEFIVRGTSQGTHYGTLTRSKYPDSYGVERDYLLSAGPANHLNEMVAPGLIRAAVGKGTLYYAATPLSRFRLDHYRLTSQWETLFEALGCQLLGPALQKQAEAKFLPMTARTRPRRWTRPGETITLLIDAPASAAVTIDAPWQFTEQAPRDDGTRVFTAAAAEAGDGLIRVKAADGGSWRMRELPYSVASRAAYYRRVLDRNMQWYLQAGVLPAPDGSEGIDNTIEIGAFRGGDAEYIGAQRIDTQLFSAKAFYLYYLLNGDPSWRDRALTLADRVLKLQNLDPRSATYGVWPWLVENNDGFYPQDDHTRIIETYIFLFGQTGNRDYLAAALRAIELINDLAGEDGSVACWCTFPDLIEQIGRTGIREIYETNCVYWSLYRLDAGYRGTADPLYLNHLDTLLRCYLPYPGPGWENLGTMGLAVAAKYANRLTPELQQELQNRIRALCLPYLTDPDVQEYGSFRQSHDLAGGDLDRVFYNDSTMHTLAGEPISDLLYSVSSEAYWLLALLRNADTPELRQATLSVLDYLAGIQCEDADPRLDGCWMRGYDFEHDEYYGTRYDPNYGAYHAYVGWTNTRIAAALACYLLDLNPLADYCDKPDAEAALLDDIRKTGQFTYFREKNELAGVQFHCAAPPTLGSATVATLTDGVIEGVVSDQLSAGWQLNPATTEQTLTLECDLPEQPEVNYFSIRLGGLEQRYMAQLVKLFIDDRLVLEKPLRANNGSNQFRLPETVKAGKLRIELLKNDVSPDNDRLYIGEIRLLKAGGTGRE